MDSDLGRPHFNVPIIHINDPKPYTRTHETAESLKSSNCIFSSGSSEDLYLFHSKQAFGNILSETLQTRPSKHYSRNANYSKSSNHRGNPTGTERSCTTYNIIVTVSSEKNAGTSSLICLRLKGDKGISQTILLNHISSGIRLKRCTTSELQVKCRDVGELSRILLENKGTKPEDGLLLSSVQITHLSTNRTWLFPIGKWLSHLKGERLTVYDFQGMRVKLTDYRITVATGDFDGAGTDSRVFIVLFGEYGESPQFKLTSPDRRDLFSSGSVSKFIIRTASLGDISHVRVSRDASGSKSGWFLKRIIVEDPSRPHRCYLFNCNDWISLPNTNNVDSSQIIRRQVPHVQSDYEYHVTFYTSEFRGAGTTSDVFLKLYGREGFDRERWFNSQPHQFGVDGSTTQFKLKTNQRLGDLIKVKVGLEAKGSSPGWLLEKVVVEDITTKRVYTFPCGQWLIPETDGATISRHLLVSRSRTLTPTIAHQQFEMTLISKAKNDQGKPTDVYFRLFGPKVKHFNVETFSYSLRMGDFAPPHKQCSPIICIPGEQINTNGKTLVTFKIDGCQRLSPSSKLALGHDAPIEAADWLLEKVQLKSLNTGITQTFWCKKWFPFYDNKLRRKIVGPQYTVLPSKKITDANWQVEVCTSKTVGAGTSARVYATLYGDQGRTDEIWLNEILSSDKSVLFEQGSCNIFKLNLPYIGIPYKMRIRHDGTGHSPNWRPEKIILQHLPTGKTYFFTCDKWLNLEDPRSLPVYEMPAFGSDITQPASVRHYRVTVETGEKSNEYLDSNVFINIFGNKGDTGVRSLHKKGAFSQGKTDEFLIEAVTLGRLEKIRIGHDGEAPTPNWYLNKVTVEEVENSANKIVFELNAWLATRRPDGSYEEELYPTQRPEISEMVQRQTKPNNLRANYTVRTRTGEILGAETDAKIYLSLVGDVDETPFVQLKHSQADSGPFRIGQEDVFHFNSPFVGKIESAKVMLESKDEKSTWYLKFLSVTVNEVSLRYHFSVDRWLSKIKSDDRMLYEFSPSSIERIFSAVPYEVIFYTGNESNCGKDTLVHLQLFGNKGGKQTEVLLFKTDGKIFSAGGADKFNVYSSEVGDITKIRVGQNGKGPSSYWLLKKILIRKPSTHICTHCHGEMCPNLQITHGGVAGDIRRCENDLCDCCMQWPKQSKEMSLLSLENRPLDEYWFFADRWLPPRDEKGGQSFCELLPAKADGTPLSTERRTMYQIRLRTGNLFGGGTSAQVYLTLIGEKSESGEFIFPNSKGLVFAKDREAVFKVEAIGLGEVRKIRLRHDNSGPSPDWYLQEVIVSANENGDERTYYFPCNQWLTATTDGSGRLLREFTAASTTRSRARSANISVSEYATENPPMTRKSDFLPTSLSLKRSEDRSFTKPTIFYEFKIYTSDIVDAGTKASVFVVLCGSKGRKTSEVQLKGVFKRGGCEVLHVDLEDVGEPLQSLCIKLHNQGSSAAWHLDRVEVRPMGSKLPADEVYIFKCNRWITDLDKTGVILNATTGKRQLSSAAFAEETNTYEITFTTGSISNAVTPVRAYLCLIGADGRTEERQLVSVKDSTEPFQPGKTDLFIWEGVPLREVTKICLRHDNTSLSPNWYVDKVNVRQITSQKSQEPTKTFICNRWISSSNEEFIPMSYKVSTPSPAPSLDSRRFDLPEANFELPTIPSLGKLPPIPSESSVPSLPLDMPLPSPPPIDLSGRPQIATVQQESNDMVMKMPSSSQDPLPPLSPTEEEEVPYKITLATGNGADAGTRGPVLMNLIGSNRASTGWLCFQNQAGNTALPAASIKTFVFSALSLKEITAIEIYNQAEEQNRSGWHLKHLRVEISNRQMIYEIPCNIWVTSKKGTHRAYRRLTITPQYLVKKNPVPLKKKPFYTLKLWVDGSIPENMRDNISLQVRGDQGTVSDAVIVNRDWALHIRLLTLQFHVKDDLASFDRVKIRLCCQSEQEIEAEWGITSAVLQREDELTSKQYYFTEWQFEEVNQQTYRCSEITSFPPAKPSVTSYKIRIKTSDLPHANTNANVYLRLIGEIVESADIHLKESETNRTSFERDQIDQFTIKNLPNLGELTGCRLWHDNRMPAGAWHCKWIYVVEVPPEGSHLSPQSWYFPCNRWLRGDGRSQVVPLDLLPLDAKAAPALAFCEPETSNSPQAEELKIAQHPSERIDETDYFIDVETSNANEAGTRYTGWLQIKGRNGISPVLKLIDPDGNPVLQTGSTDRFRMKCESLGVLQQIYVGLHDSNAHFDEDEEEPKYVNLQLSRRNQWNCRTILVTDGRDGETYLFNINQWIIATPEIDRRMCIAARPAELRIIKQKKVENVKEFLDYSTAPTVTYKISIETGADVNAGTTANAYITLYGNQKGATSGSQRLQRISNQTFARGKVDVFFISCAKLGEVNRIQIEHDNAGGSPDWFIKGVTVMDTSTGDVWTFPCDAWISLTQGSKSLRKELKSS
uniref:Lipoxygenase domain containing protein n=1 Tax=Echinococcus granulosus TaxID=6210 RepID=A0A068WY76_ECHGR|nr:lipoxygenase domain containing protein [Echinococcus granulosus]